MPKEFAEVLNHPNICLLGAAIYDDLRGIEEKIALPKGTVRYIDPTKALEWILLAADEPLTKSTYGIKDVMDYVWKRTNGPYVKMVKDLAVRMSQWNSEFRRKIPWNSKMGKYAAEDALNPVRCPYCSNCSKY